MRRWLGIDTWGMDFFRLKRRVRYCTVALSHHADVLRTVLDRLNRMERDALLQQPQILQSFEARLTALEHEVDGTAELERQLAARSTPNTHYKLVRGRAVYTR
jgi:hypothetical protein